MKALGVAVVGLLAVATAAADEKKIDASQLVGEWEYVSGVRDGEAVPKDHLVGKVTFTKDMVTVPSGDEKNPFKMAFTIDASKSPAHIDLEIKDGPVKEGKAKGLVELKGGELKLIYHPMGGERPKEFKSTKDNATFYFVLKKGK